MNSTFLTVTAFGLLAVISPGPDFLIVVRNSLLYSRRVGIATAFGIVTGNVWWIACSILGISYVISRTVILFNILKWVGAIYLIYIGICALRSKKSVPVANMEDAATQRKQISARQGFRIGLLTNILNPKCALFFMSFFSVIITPQTPLMARCAYGLEIMIIAITWFSLVATVLSFGKVKNWIERFAHWIDRVAGAIMVIFGLKIVLSKT